MNISELAENIKNIRAGEKILLSGVIYTARDAAHRRFAELLRQGAPLPFPVKGSVIYYSGPTPAPEGMIIGSCGPTTSGRMDKYAPELYDLGLLATIGKGPRSREVYDAIRRNNAVYFCALGGAGALYARCVEKAEEIAFPELGCESVKRLTVKDMPVYLPV